MHDCQNEKTATMIDCLVFPAPDKHSVNSGGG